jgi:hypothetical protein
MEITIFSGQGGYIRFVSVRRGSSYRYRVKSFAIRHKRESGLTAAARLMFVTALTRSDVVMIESLMPIRIRHRYKNNPSPQQSDISLVISQASYTALVAKSGMIYGSI